MFGRKRGTTGLILWERPERLSETESRERVPAPPVERRGLAVPPQPRIRLSTDVIQDCDEPRRVARVPGPSVGPTQKRAREEDLLHAVIRIDGLRTPIGAEVKVAIRDPHQELGVANVPRRSRQFRSLNETRVH